MKDTECRYGKWSQSNVPHRGWTCVDIDDLEVPSHICEMCETQTVRYVHHMTHADYPSVLSVGCICAGNMEGSILNAKKREKAARSYSQKKARWLSKKWKVSQKGNQWLIVGDYRIVIYKQDNYWQGIIVCNGETKHSQRKYKTENEIKLTIFDYINAKRKHEKRD